MIRNQDSEIVTGLLRSPDKEEAICWLQRGNPKHYIGEMSYADSLSLVRHLYELGSVEVVVVEVATNAGLSSTDSLILTLPENEVARTCILNWNRRHAEQMGLDADSDCGEKHLLIWFD